ncbi:hypothetical protein RB195_002136 [Necator americanus]|uniref:Uncharacterized protein n=1 Tax=Necator americanus TaxID=51031 RepID=A0ABR1DHJ4_NECAM
MIVADTSLRLIFQYFEGSRPSNVPHKREEVEHDPPMWKKGTVVSRGDTSNPQSLGGAAEPLWTAGAAQRVLLCGGPHLTATATEFSGLFGSTSSYF